METEVLPGFVGPFEARPHANMTLYYVRDDQHRILVTDKDKDVAEALARVLNSHGELVAYAKCEEAISSGNVIWSDVLKQHGYDDQKYINPAAFLDELRRSALKLAQPPN